MLKVYLAHHHAANQKLFDMSLKGADVTQVGSFDNVKKKIDMSIVEVPISIGGKSNHDHLPVLCLLEANFGMASENVNQWPRLSIKPSWKYIFFSNTLEIRNQMSTYFRQDNVQVLPTTEAMTEARKLIAVYKKDPSQAVASPTSDGSSSSKPASAASSS